MWLPDASLYSYKAREYSAALGRFMQTDPIGQDGGLNLYAYVGGDPVNFMDPLGTCLHWRRDYWRVYPDGHRDWIRSESYTTGICGSATGPGGNGEPNDGTDDEEVVVTAPRRHDPPPDWFLQQANNIPLAAMFEIMDPGDPLSQCQAQALTDAGVSPEVVAGARLHLHGPPFPFRSGYSVTTPRNWLSGGNSGSNVYLGTNSPSLGHLGHEIGGHAEGYAQGTQSFWSNLAELFSYPNGAGEQEARRAGTRIANALGNRTCP